MSFFDHTHIAFEILQYSVSYVELIGTLFGLISVYYASKANILTWPTGIVNEFCLFILFFQIQLYADMFLQVYFFVVTLYGWYNWRQPSVANRITTMGWTTRLWLMGIIVIGTLASGYWFSHIHLYLPQYFPIEAAFPYADSFVMVMSIVATILLAKKYIETWYLWMLVDVVCIVLFFEKGIVFLALEYLIFLGLVIYGWSNWKKELRDG